MECKHNHHTDEARKDVEGNIEKFGCHIVWVETGNYLPDFAYSIGLYEKFNHPEIICFGLKPDLMGNIINHACGIAEDGEKLVAGEFYEGFLQGHNVQLLPVNKAFYPDYFGYAGWFYDNDFDFPALQVVYPDLQGVFPWEDGFNREWKLRQPLLDRNTDFKFYEERNVCAFTTSQALEGDPILYVYHNEDGAWQLHTSEAPDSNDSKLVSLEHLVKQDPTLNELYSLQYGWEAWRNNVEEDWQYAKSPDEEAEEEEPVAQPEVIERPKSLFQKLGKWFR